MILRAIRRLRSLGLGLLLVVPVAAQGDGGELLPGAKPPGPSDDFTISNLNVQLRYRWELAPLSDLFVVYTLNGQSNPSQASFSKLFNSALNEPVAEQFVVKLRYRFGS